MLCTRSPAKSINRARGNAFVRRGCSMNRTLLATGLSLVMCGLGVTQALATPIVLDPIVRTRGGGGSIQIFPPLPFTFDFGVINNNPDSANCTFGPDTEFPELNALSCNFQNLTGFTITELNFTFGGSADPFELTLEDTSGFFSASIPPSSFFGFTAHFDGTGVESGSCPFEGPCTGGEFGIDLVGFPAGATAFVTSASASEVPEPATLLLVGPGLALAAKARRWRRKAAYLD